MDTSRYLRAPSEDKLERARDGLRAMRDQERLVRDLEERLKEAAKALNEMRHRTLPDLFQEVGIDRLGVPAEGNLPAYDASLRPYYKANIEAGWPDNRRAEGFQVLEDKGHGEVIRTQIVVSLGKGERDRAAHLVEKLKEHGYDYDQKMAVPWTTLTALVRSEFEAQRPFTTEQLEKIGAVVGQVVELKQRKE